MTSEPESYGQSKQRQRKQHSDQRKKKTKMKDKQTFKIIPTRTTKNLQKAQNVLNNNIFIKCVKK